MKFRLCILGISALALGGCASHGHQLFLSGAEKSASIGSFTHEGNSKPTMTMTYKGKEFVSTEFEIRSGQNLRELQKQLGGNFSKHYQRVTAGLDRDHLIYRAEPMLKSADGEVIQCALVWSSGRLPAGVCKSSGSGEFEIRAD
jgi:hypothetical protein